MLWTGSRYMRSVTICGISLPNEQCQSLSRAHAGPFRTRHLMINLYSTLSPDGYPSVFPDSNRVALQFPIRVPNGCINQRNTAEQDPVVIYG